MQYIDRKMKMLVEISTMITTTDNFFNIKDNIISKMLEIITPAKACVNLFINDYKYTHLVCSATLDFIPNLFRSDEVGDLHIPFETYPPYIHEAIRDKKIIWIKNIFEDERSRGEVFFAENEGYKSRAVFPLIANNEVIGFMTCFFIEDSDKYTEEDIDFIASVASLVGLSIEITRKKRDTDFMIKKLRGSLNFINKATDELYKNLNMDNFLKPLSKQICNVTFSESAIIVMDGFDIGGYHESTYGKDIDLKTTVENIISSYNNKSYKMLNGKFYNEENMPLFIENSTTKTILYHQLVVDDTVIGYVAVANASRYSEIDLKILNIFSTQIIFAIERYKNAARLIEHKMLEKELELIQEQQRLIMPKNNIVLPNKSKISYYFYPTNNLGGDFCSIFFINEHKLCIFVADVMGHSILANYFSAMIKGALKSCIDGEKTAAEILTIINHNLYDDFNSLDIYATARLAILDLDAFKVNIANGGHHYPIAIKKTGEKITAEELLYHRGLPLGIFDNTKYDNDYYNASDYELICIFTDGIIEAYGEDGEMFGVERLKQILIDNHKRSNDEINDSIREALFLHTKITQLSDDTMVIIINNNHK